MATSLATSLCSSSAATAARSTGRAGAAQPRIVLPPLRAALQPSRRLHHRRAAAAPVRAAQKQTYSSFEDLLQQSDVPVLVDFYATWCGPCQMQSQVIDQLAPQMRGRVKFVKVDTEKYHKVASKYNIGALPTLVLFKKGQPVDRVEGLLMGDQLKQRLEYFLA